MKSFLLVSAVLLFMSCASNSLFLDAKPIGSDNQQLHIGASIRGKLIDSANVKYFSNSDLSILPIDVSVVKGLNKQSDLYAKYTLPLTFNLGVKISFMPLDQYRHFYFALGPSIGVDLLSLIIKDSTGNNSKPIYFDIRLPIYQTFVINKYLSLSFIPNTIMRIDYRHFQMLGGCNINAKIGNTIGLLFEGSGLYNFRYREPEYQIGVNLFFPIPSKDSLTINEK
jgi:hypothetical protein